MRAMAMRRLRLVDGAAAADAAAPVRAAAPARGGHMRIAIATNDMKTVDAHFGGTRNLAIYDVSPDTSRFIEAIQFDAGTAEDGVHADGRDDHDRIGARVEALQGCALLFVHAIGGPAAARVVGAKVHPIKIQQPEAIASVLERVRTMLSGNPPPWLRKVLAQERRDDLAFADEEETET